jgi:ABC-type transport system substrate-binding protein
MNAAPHTHSRAPHARRGAPPNLPAGGIARATTEQQKSMTEGVTMGVTRQRHHFRWNALLLALVAAAGLALLVAGCGSSSSGGGTSSSTANATPKMGGTLTAAYQGEPTGLDPAVAWELESWSIEHCIFNQLVTYAPAPGAPSLTTDIATEVPSVANGGITNGGKTYTYHLRKGVMFQAPVSREVTAADFKWSLERMLNPKMSPRAPAGYLYASIVGVDALTAGKAAHASGIKVIDRYTLQINLTQPDYVFNDVMSLPFAAVLPKEWVAKYSNSAIARHPLGTGPFVFDHWSNGQEIVLKRNPNYFLPGHPYLDQLKFEFASSITTALLQLEAGKVDVLGDGIPSGQVVQVMANPTWKKQVTTAPQIAWYYVFMNVHVKPFDNVLVRQAFNYAVDTAKIQKLFYGQAQPLNQVLPVGMPGHIDGATFYTHDPAKAKQLLSQAGYPNGFSVTLYTHNVDPMPKLAQSIQNDLAQVGIKAQIKQLAKAPYWGLIESQKAKVPIGLTDWYMDYPDPSDWIGPLFSKSAATTDGSANDSWWWSPQVEALYAKALPMAPGPARSQLFEQMQRIIMQQAPTIPLYQPILTTMSSVNTGGFFTSIAWTYDFPAYWKK